MNDNKSHMHWVLEWQRTEKMSFHRYETYLCLQQLVMCVHQFSKYLFSSRAIYESWLQVKLPCVGMNFSFKQATWVGAMIQIDLDSRNPKVLCTIATYFIMDMQSFQIIQNVCTAYELNMFEVCVTCTRHNPNIRWQTHHIKQNCIVDILNVNSQYHIHICVCGRSGKTALTTRSMENRLKFVSIHD